MATSKTTKPRLAPNQTIIIPRKTATEVRKIIRDLPDQLSGRKPDPDNLRKYFLSHFTHRLMELIHEGFIDKSQEGRSDNLGTKWKPLKDATIKRKMKRRKLAREISSQLRGMTREQRKVKSEVLARQVVPIGIDTGELEKAYRPGRVHWNTYRPPKRQIVKQDKMSITVTTEVKHAVHFHKTRRIYPSVRRMRPWVINSARYARDRLVERLKEKLKQTR